MLTQSPDNYNLLAEVDSSALVMDPFPHLIVRNPLAASLAAQLTTEFPPDQVMINASPEDPRGSNKRFNIYARDAAASSAISDAWKRFIAAQASESFFRHAVRIFQPALRRHYPSLLDRFGDSLEAMRAGLRFHDSFQTHDVLLDAGISINTPVSTIPTSVRMAHLDLPTKLFTGLYYLRPPEDTDTRGGELTFCRYRSGIPKRFWRYDVDPDCVEDWKTVPYENNVFVMFLNTLDSIHAVTPRQRTRHTRKFVNLVVEVETPLFDGSRHQVALLPYRAKYYLRQLFSWTRL